MWCEWLYSHVRDAGLHVRVSCAGVCIPACVIIACVLACAAHRCAKDMLLANATNHELLGVLSFTQLNGEAATLPHLRVTP